MTSLEPDACFPDEVLPPHPATLPMDRLLSECEIHHVRRSGPGGQHRNKVSTGIQIVHRATGITAEANERRSQATNRTLALKRLRVRLALRHRSPASDRAAQRHWAKKFGGERFRIATDNDAYPTVLALLLDQVHINRGQLADAAELFNTTPSQILRLLKREPESLLLVNQWRHAAGVHPLR